MEYAAAKKLHSYHLWCDPVELTQFLSRD